jgi:hypothetical protein
MPLLAYLIALFFSAVVLPNKIGTPDMPAVGAKRVLNTSDRHSAAPRDVNNTWASIGVQFGNSVDIDSLGGVSTAGCVSHRAAQPSCRLRI